MASGIVRCAINAVLEDRNLDLESSRIKFLKIVGAELLKKSTEGGTDAFEKFSTQLNDMLESTCQSCTRYRSHAAKRNKMWCAFHKIAVSDTGLLEIWKGLFTSLSVKCDDQLLAQSTNQKLFEMILTKHFCSYVPGEIGQGTSDNASDEISLTKDELNALQYVGGFVPHALLKRFERNIGKKYDHFYECLGEMAVVSETSDFLEYTKEWISKVNRGGLFPLNDMTFLMFVAIEKQVRCLLPGHLLQSSASDEFQKNVIGKIVSNDDVQWQWTLISQLIDSEEDAVWLLGEIVKLYVTIRGFSIAATWMEVYKKGVKRGTKKTVGLRKQLTTTTS